MKARLISEQGDENPANQTHKSKKRKILPLDYNMKNFNNKEKKGHLIGMLV